MNFSPWMFILLSVTNIGAVYLFKDSSQYRGWHFCSWIQQDRFLWRLKNALSTSCFFFFFFFRWMPVFESNNSIVVVFKKCTSSSSSSSKCLWQPLLDSKTSADLWYPAVEVLQGIIKGSTTCNVYKEGGSWKVWGGGIHSMVWNRAPTFQLEKCKRNQCSSQLDERLNAHRESCCATPLIPENDVIMLKVSATPIPNPLSLSHTLTHRSRPVCAGGGVFSVERWCLDRWSWFMVDRLRGWCQLQWELCSR